MLLRALVLLALLSTASAAPQIDLQPLASGLTNVTSITTPPDGTGRLFITQQNGQIRIFDGTQLLATNFLNISALVSCCGEQGLLSLAFSPAYTNTGIFFVNYTRGDGATVVARYQVSANPNVASTNATAILVIPQPASNHNGGQLQFGPDGYLYIGMGDGGGGCDSTGPNAQNLGRLLGKMLRLDVSNLATNYTIPPGNPFVSSNGVLPEIWAYGLRNPWRFSFDRATGDLFIGDVGQNDWEEVDFQPATSAGGENYGWYCMEGFHSNTCATACATPAMVRPILEYDHSAGKCSITGGYRYRGWKIPPLDGAYVFADYCSGQIWGATNTTSGVWGFTELTNTVFNLTTFGEDQVGELYTASYSATGGSLFRIIWKDGDGNGLADDWEVQSFGHTGVDPNADPDGDRFTNLQEFLAGTDPRSSASALRILSVTPTNADSLVDFTTAAGRKYRLERADDLVAGRWTNFVETLFTNAGLGHLLDPGATGRTNSFYRVRLLP